MRNSPGHFERLLSSGELHRVAAQSQDANDLAKRLGMSPDSLNAGLQRLRRAGHHVPPVASLVMQAKRLGRTNVNPGSTIVDEWDEPTRETPIIQEVDSSQTVSDSADVGVPFQQHTPPGFHVKGLSTFFDADGKPVAQWVKSSKDQEEQFAAFVEAVKSIAEPFRGAHEPTPMPEASNDDLLCVYPFGDPHFGLYSWAQETGEDFDLEIAERVTVGAIDHLVNLAPAATQCLILTVGDTFHADSFGNQTQSGHALDVDTRLPKVLRVAIRSYRRSIDRSLQKHKHTTMWIVPGNHDPVLSVALGMCLEMYYEREPRVTIDNSPGAFKYLRFGQNLLAATHGHKAKAKDMLQVMACDRAEDWGQTKHRRVYTGHLHHDRTEEHPGGVVDILRTLAAKDAWHTEMGYRSGRDMKCDVIHRTHGLVSRTVVNVAQLLDEAA